jgi:shikimate kinase
MADVNPECDVRQHLVLVGLPGSGKSTVGRLVAQGLPAPLIDIDQLIVRQMGRPVNQIFGMIGEARFRQMEHDAVQAATTGPPSVIVPGGGWAAQPGEIEAVVATCLVVYLKCHPTTAVKRSATGEVRPLLVGGDPVQRMRELLQAREPFYTKAHAEVNADSRPAEAVAAEVMQIARQRC